MYIYSLTALTGREKNAGRTFAWKTFEVPQRGFWVAMIGLGVSLFPTLVIGALFGAYCILVPPIVIGAGFAIFEQRMSRGLQVTRYRAFQDKRKSGVGQLHICMQPAQSSPEIQRIQRSSEPAVHADILGAGRRQDEPAEHLVTKSAGSAARVSAEDLLAGIR